MSLSHVYIVFEPVGSARLTFNDDMYYELCVFDDRSLFGVPNEITDMTRCRDIKIDILDYVILTPEEFRVVSGKNGVPEGLPEPPGEVMGLMGHGRERGQPTRGAPPLGVRIGLGEGGRRAAHYGSPFHLSTKAQ